jgi:Domain found in IF2B/IF5
MSLTVNIDKSQKDDLSYRYKMPQMVTKIEGRGNGIKTIVLNMEEIAQALRVKAACNVSCSKPNLFSTLFV